MARFTLTFIALLLFGASILSVFGYSLPRRQESLQNGKASSLVSCTVKVIYDGDTLGCDFDGNGKVTDSTERVRLLGIDAPEMSYSRKNLTSQDEPFAKAATRLMEKTVLNRPIYLEFDEKRFDKYNRTLAYVYADPQRKTMLNTLLLEKGLAKILFIGENRRYESDFIRIERQAKIHHLNMWDSSTTNVKE